MATMSVICAAATSVERFNQRVGGSLKLGVTPTKAVIAGLNQLKQPSQAGNKVVSCCHMLSPVSIVAMSALCKQ